MKVLVNGGLNLSEMDGWWVEAYTPEVGWALGDGKEHGSDPAWDRQEAESLFQILEQEVIPAFYNRNTSNIPVAWVEKVRRSMATLTPYFSANRTVREYTDKFYVPAAKAYRERAADNGAVGSKIVHWKRSIVLGWPQLHFGEVKFVTEKDSHSGEEQYSFEMQLYLGDISPDMIQVELFARGPDESPLFRQQLDLLSPPAAGAGMALYGGKVPGNRPAGDYTARVLPYLPGVAVPLEATQILWKR
jgi:starch phosphorylase